MSVNTNAYSDVVLRQIREAIEARKVQFASSDMVTRYSDNVQTIIRTISEVLHNPGIEDAAITDQSKIFDFTWGKSGEEEDVEKIANVLGVEIPSADTLIWKVAEKMGRSKLS